MCLSTVYIQSGDRRIKVMQDVAQMESNQEGYLLIGLLGDQKFVKGRIKSVDFVDDHTVVLEKEEKRRKPMIPQIKRILYTTDLSDNSAYAFRYAINFAKKHDAGIIILHVLEPLSVTAKALTHSSSY